MATQDKQIIVNVIKGIRILEQSLKGDENTRLDINDNQVASIVVACREWLDLQNTPFVKGTDGERKAFRAARMAYKTDGAFKNMEGQLLVLAAPHAFVYQTEDEYFRHRDGIPS